MKKKIFIYCDNNKINLFVNEKCLKKLYKPYYKVYNKSNSKYLICINCIEQFENILKKFKNFKCKELILN